MTREELQATKPRREEFDTDNEFDEAVSRWMDRHGRSPLLQPIEPRRPELDDARETLAQILLRSAAANPELLAKQQRLLQRLAEHDRSSDAGDDRLGAS